MFSFHYSVYADFERGATLPSIEALLEIAQFLRQDPEAAVLLWCKVQMPEEKLKRLFTPERRKQSRELAEPAAPARASEAPGFENTWVLGPAERERLEKFPWIWEVLLSLSMRFPSELAPERMARLVGVSVDELLSQLLAPWLQSGYLMQSERGIRLKFPHLHIPKTPEWNLVREKNVHRAAADILKDVSHRGLIHRPLTPSQLARWTQRLRELETEFKADPYLDSDESGAPVTVAWIQLLGKRNLG
ncbi:MAG: hypothetical protein A2X94_13665 [Bdellovibrionales bacterium GWB1_55_8]|nr:MAG: hypothetical protein A2X94_13665 [Bdellovibrionales bacterium GWB1_55_8]